MATQAMLDVATAYSQTGDVALGEQRLAAALEASRRVGYRYYLLRNLNALADWQARTAHPREAHEVYREAEHFIDGMLIRFPGPYTESSLPDTLSKVYVGGFSTRSQPRRRSRGVRDHRACPRSNCSRQAP